MIRVLVVDDHQLMRQGVCALLMKAQEVKIVGEARDGEEAIALAQRLVPDIILMDIEMPRMDGLEASRRLLASGTSPKILFLSMRTDEADVREAARIGACGYLIKNSNREELIAAVRNVHQGGRVASPEVAMYFSCEENTGGYGSVN